VRAGTLDVLIQTGALWTRDVQVLTPDTPIEAQAVTAGQRVFVDGVPLHVYSAVTTGGLTTLTFGQGLYADLSMKMTATARVQPAVPAPILEADAAFHQDIDAAAGAVIIDTIISPDTYTVTLTIDAATSAGYGPYEGAHSWDCYLRTAAWDWQRVLEGTLSVVRGDAR